MQRFSSTTSMGYVHKCICICICIPIFICMCMCVYTQDIVTTSHDCVDVVYSATYQIL